MSSNLITHPPTNLSDLVDCYNSTLATLLNKHAPLKSKILHPKPANHWFTPALNKFKLTKRHLERVWSKSLSKFSNFYVLPLITCCTVVLAKL